MAIMILTSIYYSVLDKKWKKIRQNAKDRRKLWKNMLNISICRNFNILISTKPLIYSYYSILEL